jgi:amidophosphoribosyltransferase
MSAMGIRHACGVIAIAAQEPVAPMIFYGLRALQHRGQESAGIATTDEDQKTRTIKGMGLVDAVFSPEQLIELKGHDGIGHVRYSTAGKSTVENAQPQTVQSKVGTIALAHNGDIVNAPKLLEELKAKGWGFMTDNDTEVVARLLASRVVDTEDNPVKAIRAIMGDLVGAYSFTILVGDRVYAVRDPYGIRPLCLGALPDGRGHVAASESVALDVLGARLIRDVKPGEIVEVRHDAIISHGVQAASNPAHCFFEYVYFARSDARIDGHLAHEARMRIGAQLARQAPVEADLIVPVPDSGRAHATGYAREAGVPLVEALMKNRYVHRTFIMPGQDMRELNVRLKLNPIPAFLKDKRVVIVDDSIVRSTTMKRIVQLVRDAGAKEIHVRIASPPISDPCYLGVDFHHRNQLVAAEKTVQQIQESIGADSLAYSSIDGMVDAIGIPKGNLCLGCVTGEYPVPIEGERVRGQHVLEDFAKGAPNGTGTRAKPEDTVVEPSR